MAGPLSRAFWRRHAVRWLAARPDRGGIKRLLRLHDRLYYFMLGVIKASEGGIHPRHRLTDAHRFFLSHVGPGDRVLDVGSAYGQIAAALAAAAKAVTGLERRPEAVARARAEFTAENLAFEVGDFFDFRPGERYDVIVAANVLEHVRDRQAFLRKCASLADRLLVRVPAVDRDWLVPYRRELGLEWRLHPDHEIEYTAETLRAELEAAGYVVRHTSTSYGAIHGVAEIQRKGQG